MPSGRSEGTALWSVMGEERRQGGNFYQESEPEPLQPQSWRTGTKLTSEALEGFYSKVFQLHYLTTALMVKPFQQPSVEFPRQTLLRLLSFTQKHIVKH